MRRSGRLEIANHAGTPQQDAFAGREFSTKQFLVVQPLTDWNVIQNWTQLRLNKHTNTRACSP